MKQSEFVASATTASDWNTLRDDFASASRRVACYRIGDDTIFASTAAGDPITPLWLLTMARPKATALKNIDVYTNYCTGLTNRKVSETGAMQLTLDGMPKISKPSPLPLSEKPGGKVSRIAVTDGIVATLKSRFPVPSTSTAVVNDIRSASASVKNAGVYEVAGTRTVHRLYLATAYILMAHKHHSGAKDGVVALVVDKTGNIKSWGMKNPDVSCWHGETSALMALRGVVPPGGCVFSTLKPCKMCAGLLHDASGGPLVAFYGQEDGGKDAQGTALDKGGFGTLLDAHKGTGVPHGLVLKPKGEADRMPLGKTLDQRFQDQKKGGQASPIVYVTSTAAEELMNATKAVFSAKMKKYATAPTGENLQNKNTRAAVAYLSAFLDANGVKIN